MTTSEPIAASQTYCAAAWRHVQVRPDARTCVPCCAWRGDSQSGFDDSNPDLLGDQFMRDLRDAMLRGEKQAGCSTCYDMERINGTSMRMEFNERYGMVNDPRLEYIEMNFGRMCNLVCRMCGPESSSKWEATAKRIWPGRQGGTLFTRKASDLKIDYGALKRIKFIGGEPAMHQNEIRDIFNTIIQNKGSLAHLEVEVITNGTIGLEDDLLDMLKSCKEVFFQISIDGRRQSNTYQRHGSDWDRLVEIAKRYDSLGDTRWQNYLSSTMTCLTVHDFCDLFDWMIAVLPKTKMLTNMVVDPPELSIRNLPRKYKDQLIEKLQRWETALANEFAPGHRDYIVAMLRQESYCSIGAVRHHIGRLDGALGTDLSLLMPEVYRAIFED